MKALLFLALTWVLSSTLAQDGCMNTYVVQRGDTLGSLIYRYFHKDRSLFYQLNGNDTISVGQTLCLPNDYSNATSSNSSCPDGNCGDLVPQYTRGFAIDPKFSSKKLNKYSRYISIGFNYNESSGSPYWTYSDELDWRSTQNVQRVKDQGACSACWAFATTASVESAFSIVNGITVWDSDLSEQQLIDCTTSRCNGGWATDGLEYISHNGGVSNSNTYPYQGRAATCPTSRRPRSQWFNTSYNVEMYEQVNFQGSLGLILALQQQPVIVNLHGGYYSFLNYSGDPFIYQDMDCSPHVIDHTLLAIGYNLTDDIPYWILKNSWGTAWGVDGFMAMAITGGLGICGIHATPGIYPVLADPNNNPCGVINPCGSGECVVSSDGTTNTCNCPTTFIAVTNLDGSQSCAPVNVCTSFLSNPCGVGTCVNDNLGGYTCICPIQFVLGKYTDSTVTCVPNTLTIPKSVTYTIQQGDTCYLIASQFGLTVKNLRSSIKKLNCNRLVPGTVISITLASSFKGCSVSYAMNNGDTCESVIDIFGLKSRVFNTLNPGLDCTSIYPGQQVCVAPGPSPGIPICTSYQTVFPGDTCEAIMSSNMLKPIAFFSMNPGLYCDNLLGYESAPVPTNQVCVSSIAPGVCKCQRRYTVKTGDTCTRIVTLYFRGNFSRFKTLNCKMSCVRLTVKQVICIP